MEKKNSILVVLLSLIILGLCSFLVYDKVIKKEEKKEVIKQEEPEVVEVLSVDNEQTKELYDKVSLIPFVNVKAYSNIWTYYFSRDKVLASEMDDKIKIFLGLRNIDESNIESKTGDIIEGVPTSYGMVDATKVKESIENIFGKDVKYKNQSLNETNDKNPEWEFATYNEKDNKYTKINPQGGTGYHMVYSKTIKATKTSKKIEIFKKFIFSSAENQEQNQWVLYKNLDETYYKSKGVTSEINVFDSSNSYFKDKITTISTSEDATEYIEQGNTYKYTFNYDTKTKQYYFYSVEKVKE